VVDDQLVVLGTHAFAEEVADLASQSGWDVAAFVENWDRERCVERLRDRRVVWIDDCAKLAADHRAVCAVGTTRRRAYTGQATAVGFEFAVLVHPSAVVAPSAQLGPGTIVGPGAVIAAHTSVGAHVIINRGVLVGHHTEIGSWVTVSPGANIAGRVSIGNQVYIGMASVILDDKKVGDGALVGAGAMVVRDVAARTHVQGLPALCVREDIEPH